MVRIVVSFVVGFEVVDVVVTRNVVFGFCVVVGALVFCGGAFGRFLEPFIKSEYCSSPLEGASACKSGCST